MIMGYLRELVRAEKARAKAAAKAAPKPEYGVFKWTGEGVYPRAAALRVYKRPSAAHCKAERLNAVNPIYVVRTIYAEGA